ncbi:hypothetical protein RFI_31290 [Reticulomyxa filosa]|uniref:Uncharacterized protein n=1 Tax=Reticulomyxa filosa TaxID=46433 RepID=X6LY75_RETFI|nr:hypothetical protein RFI_31290 [Reticulomyxa filosa]|eukprot:ETO06107.1 hypothetical protein RFI_31290 [Reticulomyxa filosa]
MHDLFSNSYLNKCVIKKHAGTVHPTTVFLFLAKINPNLKITDRDIIFQKAYYKPNMARQGRPCNVMYIFTKNMMLPISQVNQFGSNNNIMTISMKKYHVAIIFNQSGEMLKQFCQYHELEILNAKQEHGQRTYYNNQQKESINSILDYAIINKYWQRRCKAIPNMKVLKVYTCSDHFPIKCTFSLDEPSGNQEIAPTIPKITICTEEETLINVSNNLERHIKDLMQIATMKHLSTDELYDKVLYKTYQVLMQKGAIKQTSGIINMLNVCMEYNASETVIKGLVKRYQERQEDIRRQNISNMLNKLCKIKNDVNDKKFYEIIRMLQQEKHIILHYENGQLVQSKRENCQLLAIHYKKLFTQKEVILGEWE